MRIYRKLDVGHPSCPVTLVVWAKNAAVMEYQLASSMCKII